MSVVVRRVNETNQISENPDLKPMLTHRGDGLTARSQLSVGVRPELQLSWSIEEPLLADGCTLMVFQSTTGFCSEYDPDDLSKHGNLIIEISQNGSRLLYPDEGLHYFTFVLRKKTGLLGRLFEYRSEPLRFSEMIPSAKVALGRIKDQIELKEQKHKTDVLPIHQEIELNNANVELIQSRKKRAAAENPPPPPPKQQSSSNQTGDSVIDEELGGIDSFLNAVLATETAYEDMQRDPRFQKLSPEGKAKVLKRMEERLDLSELHARQKRSR